MVTLSRQNVVEPRFSERDRGRSRRSDRGPGRQRSSRSRSPIDRAASRRFQKTSTGSEATLPACPVCLSRESHSVRYCQAPTIWNGKQKTKSTRDDEGKLLDESGRRLCQNWNQSIGCTDKTSRHVHICSGCAESTHGAQQCPLAQKAKAGNSSRC